MPSFAPFYKPPTSQQAFLTREQKRERKRKRDGSADDDDEQKADEQSPEPQLDTPRVPHPVNRTDPYYVAGHSREKSLPTGNFPHAAIKEFRASEPSVEEELAKLNPPIFAPKVALQDQAGSFRRRHMDNLTAILHKCMLHQDWERASRVWGLILRTEIQGYGPDIRQNGRWTIGAEILMRRGQTFEQLSSTQRDPNDTDGDLHRDDNSSVSPVPSDEGFELARKYYERLVLQFPDRPRAAHTTINALAIYPALFSVWIYEVQNKSSRARQNIVRSEDSSEADVGSDAETGVKGENTKGDQYRIWVQELEGGLAIAQRLDELLISPPYDTSSELLRTRGMVGLWLSDLHKEVGNMLASGLSGSSSEDDDNIIVGSRASRNRHRQQSDAEKRKARRIFERMAAAKMETSPQIQEFLDMVDDSGMQDDNNSG